MAQPPSAYMIFFSILALVDQGEVCSLPAVDRLQVGIHAGQHGFRPAVEHAGAAGGAQPSGHGRKAGLRDTGLLQRIAAAQRRQMGVEGSDILFHCLVSISLKSPSKSTTFT